MTEEKPGGPGFTGLSGIIFEGGIFPLWMFGGLFETG
jgi:hypothetical protein